MNYDHLNQVHEYWRNDIFPHLVHRYPVVSFEDYLRRFSFLPSCKWIQKMERVKLARVPFAINPQEFVKKYKSHCITYNTPAKPEDGIQRVIYQMSPTLHFEAGLWVWIENKVVNSYIMIFVCYNEEKEYLSFIDELYSMRRTGNTEDKTSLPGFMFSQPIQNGIDNHLK